MPPLRFPEFNDKGEDRRLTDLCHRIGDGIHSTPIYSEKGTCHFINGNNLNGGTIKIEPTTKRVDLEEAKKHQRPLSDDTILLSINGTIGNIAFYRQEQVILGKSACYINVDDSAASKHYIYSLLGSERVRYYFESELTGSTIRNLSLAAIRNLHLVLPSLPEQRKIADFLTAVDKRISQLSEKKALLETYKKGAIQQLFTQAIRFKDD
ncbi:MAG: restriction endonuclease subunit S, partial [Verrucomicrobiota bacterium]